MNVRVAFSPPPCCSQLSPAVLLLPPPPDLETCALCSSTAIRRFPALAFGRVRSYSSVSVTITPWIVVHLYTQRHWLRQTGCPSAWGLWSFLCNQHLIKITIVPPKNTRSRGPVSCSGDDRARAVPGGEMALVLLPALNLAEQRK